MYKKALLKGEAVSSSGSMLLRNFEADVKVFWNVLDSIDGTPSLQVTVQEVDPGDETTPNGQSVQSDPITAAGTGNVALLAIDSPTVLVTWTFSGKGSFGTVYLTGVSRPAGSKSTEQLASVVAVLSSIDQKTKAASAAAVVAEPVV